MAKPTWSGEERRMVQLQVALERRAEELDRLRQERMAQQQRVSRSIDVDLGKWLLTRSGHCFLTKNFDTKDEVMLGHVAYLAAESSALGAWREWMKP